jgi:putative ABC transport system ATP-binding protein
VSLLELRRVSRFHARGSRRVEVLREVSLEIEPGELVAVWGLRRSGRSTLLAVAAGVDPPDAGEVLFEGADLHARGTTALGNGIGYCRPIAGQPGGRSVIENVCAGLLARGVPPRDAQSRAQRALERVDVEPCSELASGELDAAETMRVAIACTLVFGPRLLVIDEPTKGVDLLDRDEIILLLRSLANDGIAVLVSDGDGSGLSDADRSLSLAGGVLRGKTSPELGAVLPLARARGRITAA